jgi:Tfp pilus assembly protein PilO
MTRFLLPIILVGASIAIFLVFVSPFYAEISDLKAQIASYDQALSNSKALENERDKLTQKFNSITTTDLERIKKLLPENVDNIRLILEIEKIASPFGMALRDVRYNPTEKKDDASTGIQSNVSASSQKEYGVWDLEFATAGTYSNFLNFIKALESNLRIVDISSIEFSSDSATGTAGQSSSYKYSFKIKTYWLKN